MTSDRDPRVDPRPGDVLEVYDEVIEIESLSVDRIRFKVRKSGSIAGHLWHFWAKDARIIARAEGPAS